MGLDQVVDPQALTVQHPAVGTQAPEFTLRSQHGTDTSPVRNGRHSLLVFFPFAFSAICASELADLQAENHQFAAAGIDVIALSCDPIYALRAMADADGLTSVTLLSDFWPHGDVARSYGCFDDRSGAASRSSFLLAGDGSIVWSLHHDMGNQRSVEQHLVAVSTIS